MIGLELQCYNGTSTLTGFSRARAKLPDLTRVVGKHLPLFHSSRLPPGKVFHSFSFSNPLNPPRRGLAYVALPELRLPLRFRVPVRPSRLPLGHGVYEVPTVLHPDWSSPTEGLPGGGGSLFPCSLPKLPYVPMFPHSLRMFSYCNFSKFCSPVPKNWLMFPCSPKPLGDPPYFGTLPRVHDGDVKLYFAPLTAKNRVRWRSTVGVLCSPEGVKMA